MQLDNLSTYRSNNQFGGMRFSPSNTRPFLEDARENKLVVQRIESLRPKPRLIVRKTESSDDDDEE